MRYARQIKFIENLDHFNIEKINKIQNNFKSKNIIIIGCGGVGSVFAELLVRGGFLNLTLVDNDIIDETNLQRQIYFESDIGKFKSNTLKKTLMKINSKSKINIVCDILNENNIIKICKSSDLIIDATDNFETRIIINNFCEKNNRNWLYTGAVKSEVICCLFIGEKKMFSKVFPKQKYIKNESCCEVGILASTTYTAASFGYNEVLRYFLDLDNNKNNLSKIETKLIKLNLWTNKLFEIKIK